jgi:hypothetical protein
MGFTLAGGSPTHIAYLFFRSASPEQAVFELFPRYMERTIYRARMAPEFGPVTTRLILEKELETSGDLPLRAVLSNLRKVFPKDIIQGQDYAFEARSKKYAAEQIGDLLADAEGRFFAEGTGDLSVIPLGILGIMHRESDAFVELTKVVARS